ncbi:MAG: hypothetical protein GOV02_00580 [Candidatus Aenigmarchaeota archaeon]|nr:hypothetical protein [Candidatus Aenigmarchaeota archaeon]
MSCEYHSIKADEIENNPSITVQYHGLPDQYCSLTDRECTEPTDYCKRRLKENGPSRL